jgi:hypothetical protein
MISRRLWPAPVLAGAALAVALALVATEDPSHPTVTLRTVAPPGTPALVIGRALHVHPIESGFLGLSLEYTAVPAYAGTDPHALNPTFLALVRNLNPGQAPVLRIGGDTTDWSWVRVRGMRRPKGIRYTIRPNWLRVMGALARALRARLILGINLEADRRRIAAVEGRAMLAAVGRPALDAFEIGNEPELYGTWGWYTPRGSKPVPGRKPDYSLRGYASDFAAFARVLPHVPLAGPSIANSSWTGRLPELVRSAPRLGVVTIHRYPLRACQTPAASSASPTIAHLLSAPATTGLAATVAPAVRAARARHLPLRVDELNSVSCRGKPGVSNAFASSLWMLNTLFAMARVGVAGVNVHTLPASSYHPFTFDHAGGTWRAMVDPDYYGMLMFAQAAPPGSRLLAIHGTPARDVSAWATRTRGGGVNVVLVNDSTRRASYVPLRLPDERGLAQLEWLRAPSVGATSGVTIGGRGFGRETTTGRLAGRRQRLVVAPVAGEYVVRLPPASAALLSFPAPRRPRISRP